MWKYREFYDHKHGDHDIRVAERRAWIWTRENVSSSPILAWLWWRHFRLSLSLSLSLSLTHSLSLLQSASAPHAQNILLTSCTFSVIPPGYQQRVIAQCAAGHGGCVLCDIAPDRWHSERLHRSDLCMLHNGKPKIAMSIFDGFVFSAKECLHSHIRLIFFLYYRKLRNSSQNMRHSS